MSETAATIVLALCVVAAVRRTLRNSYSMRWLTAGDTHPVEKLEPFVILLPVLREQALVQETLAHFEALDYPRDDFRVIVVASEREREERDSLLGSSDRLSDALWRNEQADSSIERLGKFLPSESFAQLLAERSQLCLSEFRDAVRAAIARVQTTAEVVRDLSSTSDIVTCVEAPSEWILKAGQLRYAVANLTPTLPTWQRLPECRYVGVYDFDARPALTSLYSASNAAASRSALLQQPGLTAPRSHGALEDKSDGIFSWLDGQVHSRFAFRVELASLLSDRRLYRFPRSIRAIAGSCVHTVGNGLFFDRTRLDDLGGLPEVVDDLALGWRATAIGERVEPIRSVVFYDAYPSLADARRSRAFICSGYLRAIADIHRAPDRVGAALPIHICRLYYRLLEWTFGPFTRSVALLYCAWTLGYETAAVSLLLYVLFVLDIYQVRRAWRALGRRTRAGRLSMFYTLAISPVALCWRGAGARAALVRRVLTMRSEARYSE